ncbi:MAG: hypothetical protein J0I06_14925 [Planctomycetes bacterium]|nr:hypothetical protein [Planctomycetota bacterium]
MRLGTPLLVASLLILTGCGTREPVPVPVRGTVTLDGAPLPEGKISFITPGQVPETIDVANGTFDGEAKWGQRRVEIAAYRPYRIPPDVPKSMHALMKDGKENYLPPRYHRDSALAADVKASGPNEFTFELTSK